MSAPVDAADGADAQADVEDVLAYLTGAMSLDELSAFTARLDREPELRTFLAVMEQHWEIDPAGNRASPAVARGSRRPLKAALVFLWLSGPAAALYTIAYHRAMFGSGDVVDWDGRASADMIQRPRVLETGENSNNLRTILPDTSYLRLYRNSRFSHQQEVLPVMYAALDGEALIKVQSGSVWVVNTSGGPVFLTTGTYRLRSPVRGNELGVEIIDGRLKVPIENLAEYVTGHRVRVRREAAVTRVNADSVWPASERWVTPRTR